jgi:hypothetical protein
MAFAMGLSGSSFQDEKNVTLDLNRYLPFLNLEAGLAVAKLVSMLEA